jgi:ABC-2 type transport system ATP-binding protein
MSGMLIGMNDVRVRSGPVEMLGPTSIEVRGRDLICVVGPNGSGKTTLLRVLLGRVRPTSGTLRRARSLDDRRAVASLTGPPPLFRDLTVADHLAMMRAAWGDRAEIDRGARVANALRIDPFLDRFPAELSSGERQVVGLVLALSRPALLVVLDEPEQRLDADRREALAHLLIDATMAGTAVVTSTHDDRIAEAVGGASIRLG